jgi:anthranilate phosphoribosyltransferase
MSACSPPRTSVSTRCRSPRWWGGDAAENAAIARAVLGGEAGARRTAVLINAGASLCVTGMASTPMEAAQLAGQVIDSGAATAKLDEWVAFTRALRASA